MVKHITKIRPYRVFKKDGLHFVKINNKKVYIRHATKNKLRNGDKQIVSVVVNNLLAQRKSRQRKRKNKPVLAIGSTSKQAAQPAEQPASGQSNGKIDPTKIPNSAGQQAPTTDPLYANANKRTQPQQIEGQPKDNNFSIADITSGLMNAYLLGKENMEFGKQVISGKNAQQEGFDMSNPDDDSQISDNPDIQELNDRGELLLPNIKPGDESNFQEEAATHEAIIQKQHDDKDTDDKNLEIRTEREAKEKAEGSLSFEEREKLAYDTTIARRKLQEEKKTEESDEKRKQDEMAEFEDKQVERKNKEAADLEEEKAAAGTAGASGAPGASAAPEPDSTEITIENLKNKIRAKHSYTKAVLENEIKKLYSKFKFTTMPDKTREGYISAYANLLTLNHSYIPPDIQLSPEIANLQKKLFKMSAHDIRTIVLPLFLVKKKQRDVNPFEKITPIVDKARYAQIVDQNIAVEVVRQLMWKTILEDQYRVQKGWGLTNDTIKQEGMTSDEIAQVLKKKTHHVIPVIASDQIATLLPLVNHTTQHFGFVINSQSEKKPGLHWKAIYFDRKKAECCYFDSLVSEPTEAVLRGIKQIMRKMADPLYFKLKINRIKLQSNDSSTCGPFALKFIADMYAGHTFKVATRFTDEHVSGEKSIRKYISRWGYV